MTAKILVIDIENAPNLAYVWKMWGDQYINPQQLVIPSEVMCFAAKWYGSEEIFFHSAEGDGRQSMVEAAHALFTEADIVVHYNGKSHDIPHLQREFQTAKLGPPAPFKQVDMFKVVKQKFALPYNNLEYVANWLEVGGKLKHTGFDLWLRAMQGDPEAWETMKAYNINDILITEKVYVALLPWITGHPNVLAFDELKNGCPKCGSSHIQRRGEENPASANSYWRFQCMNCLTWMRAVKADKSIAAPTVRAI